MKTITDFKVKPNQTATIKGNVSRAYLSKYNPSIVHFPAYSISLVHPQIKAVSSGALKAYLIYKIKTNPRQPGLTAAYKPMIHPIHQITADPNQISQGTPVKIHLKTLSLKVFNRRRLSLMLVNVIKNRHE